VVLREKEKTKIFIFSLALVLFTVLPLLIFQILLVFLKYVTEIIL
jgi:hypothetical protein